MFVCIRTYQNSVTNNTKIIDNNENWTNFAFWKVWVVNGKNLTLVLSLGSHLWD